MNLPGIVSGIVSGLLGIYLLIVGLMTSNGFEEIIISIIFGLFFIGVGIYMLINSKREDEIEKVKYKKSVSPKK
ncbi:hypothetical protein HN604_00960 [archaeon]|jgi:uncharacterized membrane protein YfcA|nr:hypothetical protein [archaeon]MBT6606723.1 hypothetical protein [archaeon]MBT7251966.1 hypothetical protein [archaeon]MBT7660633.1 hypothetical protein [archaeon]